MQLRKRLALRSKERGATIILVSLSMAALLGMAAVSVDYAVASEEKNNAQDAADAAALALGTECALKKAGCAASTAEWYARQNAGATATVSTLRNGVVAAPNYAAGRATVRVSKNVDHTFARVLGDSSSTVAAEATATWDSSPVSGVNVLPIGVGYCDWVDNQPTSAAVPGPSKTYMWSQFTTSDRSCAGVPGKTTATVWTQRGASGSFASFGRALWFTRSWIPGITTSCEFNPSLWNIYKDILDDWTIFETNTCGSSKFSTLTNGSIVMIPIFAKEKKTFIIDGLTYTSAVRIVGFAPFKIEGFRNNPIIWYLGAPTSATTSCTFGFTFKLGIIGINFGGRCVGITGRFIQTTDTKLFPEYTFGAVTADGQDANPLGSIQVKLAD